MQNELCELHNSLKFNFFANSSSWLQLRTFNNCIIKCPDTIIGYSDRSELSRASSVDFVHPWQLFFFVKNENAVWTGLRGIRGNFSPNKRVNMERSVYIFPMLAICLKLKKAIKEKIEILLALSRVDEVHLFTLDGAKIANYIIDKEGILIHISWYPLNYNYELISKIDFNFCKVLTNTYTLLLIFCTGLYDW